MSSRRPPLGISYHYFVELSGGQDRWIKMPCSIITDPDEFYGTAEAKEGTTTYHPTEFVEKVETERAAILLDDYGRAISPKVMNGLVGLLDDTARAQYIPGLRRVVKVAPGVAFFATYNQGALGQFVGQKQTETRTIHHTVPGRYREKHSTLSREHKPEPAGCYKRLRLTSPRE